MYSPTVPLLAATPPPLPELLLVDAEEVTARYVAPLREKFRVTQITSTDGALRHMERESPGLVVTELSLPDGSGEQLCRAAKDLKTPATVLVITSDVQQVPGAIEAGCDAVLLKPFAPNLLFARLGRLLRARAAELRVRAVRQRAKSVHLQFRTDLLLAGSNEHWPNSHCPHCAHQGVTSFEFTSYRRAWYACMACRKVWIAKRQE